MLYLLKSDAYRLGKSRLLYGTVLLLGVAAILLATTIRSDIRIGISVVGEGTFFREIKDVIGFGVTYQKALGIGAAIWIALFIGQEYQWGTWQHKWLAVKSRTAIYLSKLGVSSAVAVSLFWCYEALVLLGSGQVGQWMTIEFAVLLLTGTCLYAALGSVLCMLSMLIRNSKASALICLGYILFSESLVPSLRHLSMLSDTAGDIAAWLIRHSIYGMSIRISQSAWSPDLVIPMMLNAAVVIMLSTVVGIGLFRRYEL